MTGAILSLPQYAFMAWCSLKKGTGTTLTLYLYLYPTGNKPVEIMPKSSLFNVIKKKGVMYDTVRTQLCQLLI
jgi:hypothetical protein